MVETLYSLKNMLLEEMLKDVSERGIERLDKEKVDMIRDFASAEKDCWEAEYYRSVTEAMEGGSGYMSGNMGYNGSQNRGNRMNQNSKNGYRDSMGRYARRGYSMGYQEHIDALRMELQNADPQERERIMNEIRGM